LKNDPILEKNRFLPTTSHVMTSSTRDRKTTRW